jgi:hypothetical protein
VISGTRITLILYRDALTPAAPGRQERANGKGEQ